MSGECSEPALICTRFLVGGRVQGVFFRASTVREAELLKLRGWARNLPDGRVEVLALGKQAEVDRLGEWLRHGPPRARVDSLDARLESAHEHHALADFRVR